ncbi:hypothetical protein M0534_10715 [Methylonatrum kenyense]|uniref:glycosyltransferase n=1 Tax=Methylonatrum kenyense TaxID=455253 RepID=UPI0020C00F1A|nr:glycosyltransferase [Methylonatrum kenyense]MCK8516788.1 hypothetical protein [Methylonatrum kenyense]
MTDFAIWVTWEDHRRSRELAEAFGFEYFPLESGHWRYLRYLILTAKTASLVRKKRPRLIVCQNPSVVLAAVLCFLKRPFNFCLVVDRHSNFKLQSLGSKSLKWRVFHFLSRWTIKKSDLTVVTNSYLANVVESWGGRAAVLQDRIPGLIPSNPERIPDVMAGNAGHAVTCITTYGEDEPIGEIIAAGSQMENVSMYLTGRYQKTEWATAKDRLSSSGVFLTGFLNEKDYVDLINKSDVVVVLTCWENLLTCGAYEGLALRKPLVLSDTEAIKSYFSFGAVYVEPEASAIQKGIEEALRRKYDLEGEINDNMSSIKSSWKESFEHVRRVMEKYAN